MKDYEYRSIKKQLYLSISVIGILTLLTVMVANNTAQQLSDSYQRAAIQFVPLKEQVSRLQSSSANLKSELFALKSEQRSINTPVHIQRLKYSWQQIRELNTQLLASPLLAQRRDELESVNDRIRQYIIHTDHLAQLFIARAQINSHKQRVIPRVLALLETTKSKLLPKLLELNQDLEKSISLDGHAFATTHSHRHIEAESTIESVKTFLNVYTRAFLLSELMVQASTSENVKELNRLKREVFQLSNSIEEHVSQLENKEIRKTSREWLSDAKALYSGAISVFNNQLAYIRTEKVIETLISQQATTADDLLITGEQIRVYLQDVLAKEAEVAERKLEHKKRVLWGIAIFGIILSLSIAYFFIQRHVVARVTNIRTNIIELSYGNTSLHVERQYRDELGDMEEALVLLQGYVKQVQTMAKTDPLTKLNNRNLFTSTLNQSINECKNKTQPIALMILDIDFFKQYNDLYGHPAGDRVIVKIADILTTHCTRKGDFVARIGGEEFAVILPYTGKTQVEVIAERIMESVAQLKENHQGSTISEYVTLSIGIKVVNALEDIDSETAYIQADQALYQAKETRNSINIV